MPNRKKINIVLTLFILIFQAKRINFQRKSAAINLRQLQNNKKECRRDENPISICPFAAAFNIKWITGGTIQLAPTFFLNIKKIVIINYVDALSKYVLDQ